MRVDASYKICKLIKVRLSTKAAACCYTVMSGDGLVLGSYLLPEESKECLQRPIDAPRERFRLHGFDVLLVYTDMCCEVHLCLQRYCATGPSSRGWGVLKHCGN